MKKGLHSPQYPPRKLFILDCLKKGDKIITIAAKLGISRQYVDRVKREFQKKGELRKVYTGLQEGGVASQRKPTFPLEKVRLHAQRWDIRLPPYLIPKSYTPGKIEDFEGCTVQYFAESILLVAKKGLEFYGENEQEAFNRSLQFWAKTFVKVENKTNILFLKEGKLNRTLVNAHWATTPCNLSKEAHKRDTVIQIYAEDGKLRFLFDWSKNFEREAVHKRTGKEDSERMTAHVTAMLSNEALNVKDLTDISQQNIKAIEQLTANISKLELNLSASIELHKATARELTALISILKPRELQPEETPKGPPYYVG
jgi:hypothetical protein